MPTFDLNSPAMNIFKRLTQASILLALLFSIQASALAQGAKSLYYRQLDDSKQITNLGLTYSIELIRNGKTALVDSRFPFLSGDQLRFHVQSNVDGFLYILLRHGSRGDSGLLFPAGVEDSHVSAGKDILVPAKGVLEFDQVAGTETIRLVLSPEKLQSDPASYSRSIMITPKQKAETISPQYLVDFALNEKNNVIFKNSDNFPNFAKEPAVTVVSTDPKKPLSVEMDLFHGAARGDSARSTSASALSSIKTAAATSRGLTTKAASSLPSNIVTDKWAVLIGISEFKNPKWNLLYPAKDAQDLGKFLVDEGHFAPDHVKVLTNSNATRENILTTLGGSWLPNNAKANDIVLVYFASHGTSAEQDVARKSFLLSYDTDPRNAFATGIELQDLARTIKRRVNSDRIIIVLDACHSGAAEPGAKALFPPQSFSYKDLLQGSGQMLIASASENQIAHDSLRYKNGIFTKHFIDGLKQNKNLADAFAYSQKKVEEECKQDFHDVQSPVLKDSEWKGAGVVLLVPPAQPSKARD